MGNEINFSGNLKDLFKDVMAYIAIINLTLFYLLQQTKVVLYLDQTKTRKVRNRTLTIPAETNGLEIRLYKPWLDMPMEKKIAVILHELIHILHRHPLRAKNIFAKHGYDEYIHFLTNVAMDAKVNYTVNQLFGKVIVMEFRDLFTEEELEKESVEELADKLINRYKSKNKMPWIASVTVDVLPLKPSSLESESKHTLEGTPSKSEKSEYSEKEIILNKGKEYSKEFSKGDLEKELNNRVVESIIKAKISGASLSGIEERILKELLKPKVNWEQILRQSLYNYIMKYVVSTWTRPNRKIQYYPGIKKISVPDVWAFIDVSGSISAEEFKQFMSEVAEITRHGGKVHVVTWDTEVTGYYTITSRHQVINVKFKGGGGTTFAPVFEKFKDKIKPTDVIVILTDGYWFDKDQAVHLLKQYANRLIICTTSKNIPVGKNILIRANN